MSENSNNDSKCFQETLVNIAKNTKSFQQILVDDAKEVQSGSFQNQILDKILPYKDCPRCGDMFYHPKTEIEGQRQRAQEWEEVAKKTESERDLYKENWLIAARLMDKFAEEIESLKKEIEDLKNL